MKITKCRKNEVILIGEDVVVVILESHRGSVKVGIAAPKETVIVSSREEFKVGKEIEMIENAKASIRRILSTQPANEEP